MKAPSHTAGENWGEEGWQGPDGGRGQEGSHGGEIKEDQTGKDMRQTPAAGVTQCTCEMAETWLKEPKM